jgi:membrane fusion protein (multidrug efflux system)
MSHDVSGIPSERPTPQTSAAPQKKKTMKIPLTIVIATVVAIGVGQLLFEKGTATHGRALADAPRAVTAVKAERTTFQPERRFVGTVEPWIEAKIGPQVVAAYVKDVRVRPGAQVESGELLATLDCRSANAMAHANEAQAQAVEKMQRAISNEAQHMQNLAGTGYISQTEAEKRSALSVSEAARAKAVRAELAGSHVAVSDCALRAPFAGEIGFRYTDPGAFAAPGTHLLSVVDRSTVRIVVNVPETDFDNVAPGTPVRVHFLTTGRDVQAEVTRRSPEADPATRTVEVEIDLQNRDRSLPIHTTAEVRVKVGSPAPALRVPLLAATVRGQKARLFVIKDQIAHQEVVPVLGDTGGALFIKPELPKQAVVVTEGRTGLHDGDRVAANLVALRAYETSQNDR